MASGPSADVADAYLTSGVERVDRRTFAAVDGSPVLLLRSVAAVDASGTATSVFRRDQPFTVEVDISFETPVGDLNIAISIRSLRGLRVLEEALSDQRAPPPQGSATTPRASPCWRS